MTQHVAHRKSDPKQKVYLAGPMSGREDLNFPAFHAAAKYLRSLGYEVFSPAEHDLEIYGSVEATKRNAKYKDCLHGDIMYILEEAETVALLPGWEHSPGAFAEWAVGKALGLPFLYLKEGDKAYE